MGAADGTEQHEADADIEVDITSTPTTSVTTAAATTAAETTAAGTTAAATTAAATTAAATTAATEAEDDTVVLAGSPDITEELALETESTSTAAVAQEEDTNATLLVALASEPEAVVDADSNHSDWSGSMGWLCVGGWAVVVFGFALAKKTSNDTPVAPAAIKPAVTLSSKEEVEEDNASTCTPKSLDYDLESVASLPVNAV
jgi:hypothetical protein